MNKRPLQAKNEARWIALLTIYDVLEKGAYANISLDQHLLGSQLSVADRHLVTEITNGTIRMLKHLDWVLKLFLTKPVSAQNPWLRNILRMSAYQMLFMEKVPDYAVVNSAVLLVRSKGGNKLAGVANGVLRNLARSRGSIQYPQPVNSLEYLSVYYSEPEWLVKQWLDSYDPVSVRLMLEYFNQRPGITLRNNQLRGSRQQLIETLRSEGVKCDPSPLTPWGVRVAGANTSLSQLGAYRQGLFYVQNEASMLAVSLLDPRPGEHIIDLCSGVGGKATFMAELMGNTGHIDALELYAHKLALLHDNCQRLGVHIVQGRQQDILQMRPDLLQASGVLLDAPCSGLGVLHRRSDLRWRKTPEQISEILVLQSQLLRKAAEMVKPGGRLIYTTCTVNRQENEDRVTAFLTQHPGFGLVDFQDQIPYFPLDMSDRQHAESGMLTLLPGKYGTDGMFYACMRRN